MPPRSKPSVEAETGIRENGSMAQADQEQYESILVLNNMVEADLMERLLNEAGLPFFIREWHDVNYDGIWVEQKGWGWVMGRTADEEAIRAIYRDRIAGGDGPSD